ncbi:GGDEF domain-containing protein [Agrobacterium tumefaciens]|uniref:GGDEF domain-containing protein n=1 Tax=Agrobacterium TaxID=357 RepID=UPI000DCFE585|nr:MULTISPECIES: GGDEF domain-containing protein [Agrobacterium]NSY42771.1 GGDEF domain-containing protein [Agrobacterium tumefaciens]NSZ83645.1 GGDEF domain-containing protein [Agrobacterium tumefaciens]WCA69853.1 GGDEF domain-containing protein [Agrobacterium tumefaciens]
MQWANLALFVAEAIVYFSVMTAFLHYRHILGIGVFLTALGVMHFLETYLAAVFYVELPFGVVSPGSSILFAGKLMMILMLYMREDAAVVRQPIYGLFLGNILTIIMVQIIRFHPTVAIVPGQSVDTGFLDEMGVLMVWGTSLLYIDAIAIILFYEKLGRYLQRHIVLRFAICGVVILSLDQAGFYAALRYMLNAPVDVFYDGWKAKMVAVAIYALLFAIYLKLTAAKGRFLTRRSVADVFNDLTFRERYEELLSRSGRDMLTGVPDRARMELDAPSVVVECLEKKRPVSVLIVDIDHFKTVNDTFGHLQGDEMLREFAAVLKRIVQPHGHLYRFGGEEFVALLPTMTHEGALAFSAGLRTAILKDLQRPDGSPLTVSIGVATAFEDGQLFRALLSEADARLYAAKNNGRDQVHGRYGMWVG